MKSRKDCRRSNCPISFTLDILGDKWTLLVIRDLIAGKKHYGEFLRSDEKIATNILADRLKRLEQECLITKTLDPENQTKYLYDLTQRGIDLVPVIIELAMWGAKYDPNTGAPKKLVNRIKKDRQAVINEIIKSLKQAAR